MSEGKEGEERERGKKKEERKGRKKKKKEKKGRGKKQGWINGNPVADGWAGAVIRKALGIQTYRHINQHGRV